jgi:hypothetical protein
MLSNKKPETERQPERERRRQDEARSAIRATGSVDKIPGGEFSARPLGNSASTNAIELPEQ